MMRTARLSIMTTFILFLSVFLSLNLPAVEAASKPSITMQNSSVKLVTGQTKQLTIKAVNTRKQPIVWSSSNPAIVRVSKGKVTGLKIGKAQVTAAIPRFKIRSVVTVTVTKKLLTAKQAFDKVNRSVVFIESYNKYGEVVSTGSGFILSRDGRVATNHHVVSDITEVSQVQIKLANGKQYKTNQVLGYDFKKDVVVLKIAGVNNLSSVELGDSSKVKTGEKVYALGSPKGIQNTITEGIISNRRVEFGGIDYIQSTAPINPGSSGGVLINEVGEVIGINTWIYRDAQNMNYALPINLFKSVKQTSKLTLLSLNRKFYVPPQGEGTIEEQEFNGSQEDANQIGFAESTINGQFSSNIDMDYYSFLLTDKQNITLIGVTRDADYLNDFRFAILDEDGDVINGVTVRWSAQNQFFYGEIEEILEPGFYYLVVYAKPDTLLDFTSEDYVLFMSISD